MKILTFLLLLSISVPLWGQQSYSITYKSGKNLHQKFFLSNKCRGEKMGFLGTPLTISQNFRLTDGGMVLMVRNDTTFMIDNLSKKIYVVSQPEETQIFENPMGFADYTIRYESDTLRIAGYLCHKAVIIFDEKYTKAYADSYWEKHSKKDFLEYVIYYSPEIPVAINPIFPDLKGCPLKYAPLTFGTISDKFKNYTEAKIIKKDVSFEAHFPQDYTIIYN